MKTTTNYSFSRLILTTIVLIVCSTSTWSQVASNYNFSQLSGTYSAITGGTLANDGFLIPSRQFDDDEIEDIPLGFTFNYNGSPYTTVSLSTNGFLTFNTILTTYTPISSTSPNRVISGFGADLVSGVVIRGTTTATSNQITAVPSVAGLGVGQALSFISNTSFPDGTTITSISGSGPYTLTMSASASASGSNQIIEFNYDSQISGENPSEIRYQTIGAAPNRTFVAQFTRVSRYGYLYDNLNFQIRLNENGSIEFAYGTCEWSNSTQIGVQVGLKGNSNADFNNRQGSDWNSTTAGTLNSSTVLAGGSNTPPTSGTIYRWTECVSLPTVLVSPNSSAICQGDDQVLSASGASTYSWAPAASLSASTGASVIATPTVTTTYTVTGTDGSGCKNTATVVVTVNTIPVLSGITGSTSVCPETTTSYSTTNVAGASYNWTYSSNWITNSGSGTNSVNVTVVDTSFVTVTATNGCGTSDEVSIFVNSQCPKPTGVTTTAVNSTSATISWNSASCNLQYTVQIKEVGTGVWTSFNAGSNTSYNFTGLAPLKNYQYKVINVCSTLPGSPILFGPVYSFSTPSISGCNVPQNIIVSNITANTATITWDAQSVFRFRLRVRPVGSTTWTPYLISGNLNSITLTSLNPATNYEFQIRTECTQGVLSGFSGKVNFSTLVARLSENSNTSDIVVYPNPVMEQLNIVRSLDANEQYDVLVLNTMGQLMMSLNNVSTSVTSIDMTQLAAGIYYINIKDEKAINSYKVVKQ